MSAVTIQQLGLLYNELYLRQPSVIAQGNQQLQLSRQLDNERSIAQRTDAASQSKTNDEIQRLQSAIKGMTITLNNGTQQVEIFTSALQALSLAEENLLKYQKFKNMYELLQEFAQYGQAIQDAKTLLQPQSSIGPATTSAPVGAAAAGAGAGLSSQSAV